MAIIIDPVSIEPMRYADVESVAQIERRSYPSPWNPNAYYTELSNRAAAYFVARSEGHVVGYGGMWVIMDEAHITTLAVDPDYRGRKIGERLLIAMLEEAIFRGGDRASLEVRESNVVAQNLYKKYGFREAAIRKNYYSDNHENAVVMWADNIRDIDNQERIGELKRQLHVSYYERTRHRNELR